MHLKCLYLEEQNFYLKVMCFSTSSMLDFLLYLFIYFPSFLSVTSHYKGILDGCGFSLENEYQGRPFPEKQAIGKLLCKFHRTALMEMVLGQSSNYICVCSRYAQIWSVIMYNLQTCHVERYIRNVG